MAAVDALETIVEHTLCELANAYGKPKSGRTLMAFDREHGQFLLLDEGWDGARRIHTCLGPRRSGRRAGSGSRRWNGRRNSEPSRAGRVPRDKIVLAFYAPQLRPATEFAA